MINLIALINFLIPPMISDWREELFLEVTRNANGHWSGGKHEDSCVCIRYPGTIQMIRPTSSILARNDLHSLLTGPVVNT